MFVLGGYFGIIGLLGRKWFVVCDLFDWGDGVVIFVVIVWCVVVGEC